MFAPSNTFWILLCCLARSSIIYFGDSELAHAVHVDFDLEYNLLWVVRGEEVWQSILHLSHLFLDKVVAERVSSNNADVARLGYYSWYSDQNG